jgi:hypothetical protein
MNEALVTWVRDALFALGGSATIVDVAKEIWTAHEGDLREMSDSFYTWQYDMRWAAWKLRSQGEIKPANESPRGYWELTTAARLPASAR